MSGASLPEAPRVLVVDDNQAIHNDFRTILCPAGRSGLEKLETAMFGPGLAPLTSPEPAFDVHCATQGEEALRLVEEALRSQQPFSVAFVDTRMPPGWDGIETATRLWEVAPDLQVVICTAYSDYSWQEISARLKYSDRYLILKKPFDPIEVQQMAATLSEKWRLARKAQSDTEELRRQVVERTADLHQTVSEQREAERRMRQQAALLDLASDAILVRDLAGEVSFWNKSAERLYGWTAQSAIGSKMIALFPEEDGASEVAEQELLARGEWTGELTRQTLSGREVVVNSRWTLLRDEEGQAHSVLIIDSDVTETKRLEAQFLRAQRIESIGTLATGMAHDLNNILAPILMSAGFLRWDTEPEEREKAISRIEVSVKRGAEIIQQVLTFGKGIDGERVAVDTAAVVGEISRIIGQTFPKNIKVHIQIDSALWSVVGDRTQLYQVLLNLCVNARDAMSQGGDLWLRVTNKTLSEPLPAVPTPAPPGSYVLFEVADTGCGIPPSDRERIFDPFFTTKELGKGTGLGLSTALGIVKSHRGVVMVESEVGKGTTFKVFLPAASRAAHKTTSRIERIYPHGQGEVILLVDDEQDVLAGMVSLLERHKYRVLTASNGEEALATAQSQERPVDAMITDVMMPTMDGIALIRHLRQTMPDLKIIASSGLGTDLGGSMRAEELKSLGVSFFLAKPYGAEKLLTALHQLLRGAPRPYAGLRMQHAK